MKKEEAKQTDIGSIDPINQDLFVFIAILRQKAYFADNNIIFNGQACFDFHHKRVAKENQKILKIICGLDTASNKEEKEQLDSLQMFAL